MKITKAQRYYAQEIIGLTLLISIHVSVFFWFINNFIDAPTMLGNGWFVVALFILMMINSISKSSNQINVEDTWDKISVRKKRRKIGLKPNDVEPIYANSAFFLMFLHLPDFN